MNRFWALVAGALLLFSTPAFSQIAMNARHGELVIKDAQNVSHSVVRISHNYGGSITEFIEEYSKLRDTETKVRIVDFCVSACTLTLAILDPAQVCAEPNAIFGFHSAWQQTPMGPLFAKEATRLIWNIYPEHVREVLRERGWDGDGEVPHPDIIYVKATELMRPCEG